MSKPQFKLPFLEDATVFSNGIIYRSEAKNSKKESPYQKIKVDNNKAYYSLAQYAKLPDMSTETVLTQDQAERAYQLEYNEFNEGPAYHFNYTPVQPDIVVVFMLKNALVTTTGPIRLFKSSSVIPYLLITSIDMNNMRHYDSQATIECEGVYGAVAYELKKGTELAKSLDPYHKTKEELREIYVTSYDNKEVPTIVLDGLYTTFMLSIVSGVTGEGNYYEETPFFSLLPHIHSIYTDCIEFEIDPNVEDRIVALQDLYRAIKVGEEPGEWTVTVNE